ncbi:sulfur transferase domain-containing protein [Flagellatimonas centrodinii]|uniref:beta-lactamase hydrolase domain-containing protein n=1 Tax=Flagellatimonas centrodinii TaxID=2806210 RepID=UPI001FEFC215|nr:sulfur transferase domain-containing protein [Flagellatimonas centrodinii]ULQ45705.1 sulfur transferase domain-containing protein [Flagellatimonas centrodinii]
MNPTLPPLPMMGRPLPNVITAGQPSPEDFQALKAAGVTHVINLRPATEDAGFDQAALMQKLGLDYMVIPVAGADDLNADTARALDAAMAKAGETPVLVHCASANRVGALLALRAAWLMGTPVDQALALGRAGGLTRMEPMVAQLLQRGP